jgi:hypothetical protein
VKPVHGVARSRDDSPGAVRIHEMRWQVVRENVRRFTTGGTVCSVFDLTRGYWTEAGR